MARVSWSPSMAPKKSLFLVIRILKQPNIVTNNNDDNEIVRDITNHKRKMKKLVQILHVFLFALQFNLTLSKRTRDKKDRPNIVLFVADDLDIASEEFLSFTRRHIGGAEDRWSQNPGVTGATMSHAYVTTPICCPSRSSILTGMYARNHNIMTNMAPVCGGQEWREQRENTTFAKYLHDFQYKTAMFGKYLNEYDGSYVPTGWDTWHGLVHNSRFYNYKVRVHGWSENNTDIHANNSFIERHKDEPLDYFTDVIANRSSQWVRDQHRLDPDSPKLLVVNFPGPHGPADAAPRHTDAFKYEDESQLKKSRAFNNVDDNENRNWFLRATKGQLTSEEQQFGGQLRRKRLQTLLSLDEAVKKVYFTFKDLGLLEQTYMIFTSDHGFHIGQFGMVKGKSTPYEFDVRVPMYVLGKDIKRTTQSNVVLNIDLAPTILGLAYLMPPKHMDGMSMAGVWRGKYEQTRDQFIIEKHASIISRGSAVTLAKFDKDKQVEEFCLKLQTEEMPLDSCSGEKDYKCSHNEDTGKWKVQTCKLPGFIHPATGQCNCESEWVNKIKPNRRPQRDTHKVDSHENTNSRSRGKRRNRKNDRRVSSRSRKSRRKMKPDKIENNELAAIGRINDLQGCSIKENRVSCEQLAPRVWRQNMNTVKERIDKLKQEIQRYEQIKKHLLEQKKQRKNDPGMSSHYPSCFCRPEPPKVFESERKIKKERKQSRLSDFQKSCKKDGMSCFTVDDKYWTVEPTWKGDPQCHCSMTSVQGYSCLRKIGTESRTLGSNSSEDNREAYDNFIYCEFYLHQRKSEDPDNFEVFYEYYDLDEDEDQLVNAFYTLPEQRKDDLKISLSKLKDCKGKNCGGLDGGLKRQTKKGYPRLHYKDIRKRNAHKLWKPMRTIESSNV